jgi:hypothetical protein
MHERGLADHELVGDDERDRFAGTSAERPAGGRAVDDEGGDRRADERETAGTAAGRDSAAADAGASRDTGSTAAGADTGAGAAEPRDDYERGRHDEAAEQRDRLRPAGDQ